jgi:hypothetical protein
MKRATITVPPEIELALDHYVRDQEAPPALTAVVQAALTEFLTERGYLRAEKRLRIRPASVGSGTRDSSVNHDRYLTDK